MNPGQFLNPSERKFLKKYPVGERNPGVVTDKEGSEVTYREDCCVYRSGPTIRSRFCTLRSRVCLSKTLIEWLYSRPVMGSAGGLQGVCCSAPEEYLD